MESTLEQNGYARLQESLSPPHISLLIVPGQGPVKPVLLDAELTEDQHTQWEQFKKSPLKQTEPDFRVIEGEAFLSQISDIRQSGLTETEQAIQIQEVRSRWQHTGRFALNRWGRENALAAGLALRMGITDKVILAGGKTKPGWVGKSEQIPQLLKDAWPSEAELMRGLICARFGADLIDRIILEDSSTNTLENITNIQNMFPHAENVGLLTANFHLRRVNKLTDLFEIQKEERFKLRAQNVLKTRAELRGGWAGKMYINILSYMSDPYINPDLMNRLLLGEDQWTNALDKPELLRYWLGYIVQLNAVSLIRAIMSRLREPEWLQSAREHFRKVGLDFDSYGNDESVWTDPEKIQQLRTQLTLFQKGQPGNLRDDPKAPPYTKRASLEDEEIEEIMEK